MNAPRISAGEPQIIIAFFRENPRSSAAKC